MKVEILFDKDTKDKKLHTGWGVSFLVDNRILFDTGEKGEWLLANMEQLKVDAGKIETVVISHDHWDHQGGLWKVLEANPAIKVYACHNFSKGFKDRVKSCNSQLVEVEQFTQIVDGVYTTGEIAGKYAFRYMPEQALILKTMNGLTMLTGCAHPGIVNIIENVKKNIPGDIYLVLGGFHLITSRKGAVKKVIGSFKQLGVQKVAPTHCTGNGAIDLFKEEYGDRFIVVKVGQILDI